MRRKKLLPLRSQATGLLVAALVAAAIGNSAHAEPIGGIISYQGKLSGANGQPVTDGLQSLTFKIYEEGTEKSSQPISVVTVGGVFNAFLGVGSLAFDPAKSYELGVIFNGTEEKHALAAVPFALKAKTVASVPTATSATNFSGALAGDVTGTQGATAVAQVGGQSAADVATAATAVAAATPDNTPDTLVKRNSSGGVSLGAVVGDNSFLATGTLDSNPIPAEGAGTRWMWHGGKGALRAGTVEGTEWNNSTIGKQSAAFGFNAIASGDQSFATGDKTVASGRASVAMGFQSIASGASSIALGVNADTNSQDGSFVFSDRSIDQFFRAGAPNSFNVRAVNGYRLFSDSTLTRGLLFSNINPAIPDITSSASLTTNSGAFRLVADTNPNDGVDDRRTEVWSNGAGTAGVRLPAGSGAWQNLSDRNAKQNIRLVNSREILRGVLRLPISTWSYKTRPQTRHIGAMAQDFYRAFKVGEDDKHISNIDPDGLALAAIQGLNQEIKERDAEIATLEAQIKARKAAFEARLKKLEAGR